MPSLTTYGWFLLTAGVFVMVPGPSVLFIVGRSIAHGRRAGLLSVLGNALGVCVVVTAVALGIGALITASHLAFVALKAVGAAYLVWLGVQTIRHRRRLTTAPEIVTGRRILLQSFVVGFTNPKTLAFFAAVLPQFVSRDAGPAAPQLEILGLTFVAIALCSDSVWAVAAGTARAWLAGDPRRLRRLTGLGGAMMITLGGVLLGADNHA